MKKGNVEIDKNENWVDKVRQKKSTGWTISINDCFLIAQKQDLKDLRDLITEELGEEKCNGKCQELDEVDKAVIYGGDFFGGKSSTSAYTGPKKITVPFKPQQESNKEEGIRKSRCHKAKIMTFDEGGRWVCPVCKEKCDIYMEEPSKKPSEKISETEESMIDSNLYLMPDVLNAIRTKAIIQYLDELHNQGKI